MSLLSDSMDPIFIGALVRMLVDACKPKQIGSPEQIGSPKHCIMTLIDGLPEATAPQHHISSCAQCVDVAMLA